MNLARRLARRLAGRLSWVWHITALRIAMLIAVAFAGLHFVIESEFFEEGPLSKKGLIHALDLKALDVKSANRPRQSLPEPQIVIAGIDEKGVERYGRWPWSRQVIARFIRKATQGGAKVIAFDAVFSDEDKNSAYVTVKRFLDDFEHEQLTADSGRLAELARRRDEISELSRAALEALGPIESQIGKGASARARRGSQAQASAVDKRLRELRMPLERMGKAIDLFKTSVEDLRTRASAYERTLRNEVVAISPDEALAAAIGESPQTILGYFNFYNEAEVVGVSPNERERDLEAIQPSRIDAVYERVYQDVGEQQLEMLRPVANLDFEKLQVRPIVAAQAPLATFARRAQAFGYFNVPPDPDGVMRRVRLLNKYRGAMLPALSLLAAARYFNAEIYPMNGSIKPGVTLDGISLSTGVNIPTDMHGRLLINYFANPEEYFPRYSVADFIDDTVPKEAYAGKVVMFGMTAQGLFDLRPTPFSATTPGVYVHATAAQNIIDGRFLERYYGLALIEILGYLLLGLLMGLVLPRLPAWAGVLATLGFGVGLYFFDAWFVFPRGIWMLNVLPTIQAVITYIGVSVYGYLTEGREKRQIRKAFQFYLTKSVVDEMLKDTSKLRLGGEKRVCTVLFSDIRGFTTISEKLSPEGLVSLLNEYLTPMTNLVFKYDGTLDKYMGDAIMAIFGAPVAHPNHAVQACQVALEMMQELVRLRVGWRARGVPELDIGIGLNTGPMSVGNMGSEVRFDYTVMGDNVNLGSRLEGINKTYGTNIIISQFTKAAAGNQVVTREMDSVRVKGKKEPVVIHELLGVGAATAEQQALITAFQSAMTCYKAQQWDDAVAVFERIRTQVKPGDRASGVYIERCRAMAATPPGADWDGVFTMTTK